MRNQATIPSVQPAARRAAPRQLAAGTGRKVPRSAHADIGHIRRDPVDLIEISSAQRVERLVALRYGRMLASPFAFFRGSAILQAHDLASVPHTGIVIQICGDCHLANFGGFATPERALVFDLNDFDETSPAPWEWDLKRLAASCVVAARHLRHRRSVGEALVRRVVGSYQQRMAGYARTGPMAIWHDLPTFERLLKEAPNAETRRRLQRSMARAGNRTSELLLPKLAQQVGHRWVLRDAPPALFHIGGAASLLSPEDGWRSLSDRSGAYQRTYAGYLATLAPDRRHLLAQFAVHDYAFKVVGVGSVGTRCTVHLLMDAHGNPLFLQGKEAAPSVVARYFPAPAPAHEGQRVVEGQRLMQAASDAFLGWTLGPAGRHFYVRQLRDMKIAPELELMDAPALAEYAALCGAVLARAHAKAGGCAGAISRYLGRSDRMASALVAYSKAYADQVERDYAQFAEACRSGRLQARTDADMAADFGL